MKFIGKKGVVYCVIIGLIFCESQKELDKVLHKRLISKLRSHGIGEHLCAWIRDWLSDRKQCVVLNGEVSNWLNVTSGVAKGSLLGPTLLIIYVNDLESDLISKVAKFTDDTKLGGKTLCHEDCSKIHEDINKLIDVSEKWQMSFNVDKCRVGDWQ